MFCTVRVTTCSLFIFIYLIPPKRYNCVPLSVDTTKGKALITISAKDRDLVLEAPDEDAHHDWMRAIEYMLEIEREFEAEYIRRSQEPDFQKDLVDCLEDAQRIFRKGKRRV